MTRKDALHVVEMILNSWPGMSPWSEDQIVAYAVAIEDLDAEHVTNAVARAVKELKFRPTVAELRDYARVEARVEHRWRDEPAEKLPPPEWYPRWTRARAAGDTRPFPEQALAMRDMGYDTPDAPYFDPEAWIQADEYLDDDGAERPVEPPALVKDIT